MHITIAGNLGSGKSTICGILNQKHGFEVYSTGKIQRELAIKFGVSTLEMNIMMKTNPEYDHIIDDTVRDMSIERAEEKLIFDSRMAWHFAVKSFKIFVKVDPMVAAQRVMYSPRGEEETYESVEDACEKLVERSKVENERFKDIYNVDNFDFNNYDLILDSTFVPAEKICEVIMKEYELFCANPEGYTTTYYDTAESYK